MSPTRIAIIGAGHWGPNLIRAFHNHERSEVAWVVDRNLGRLAQIAGRLPGVQFTDRLDEALADTTVQAAVVSTPTSTHYDIARQVLDAGKHVLVEKPISTSAASGLALCALAEERGCVLMVGHVFLYNGGIQRVKKYLDDGELGRIYYLDMARTNLGPIRADVSAAWDLAAHDVSIANWWLGSEPLSVSASGGTWINAGVADTVFATLRYPGDVLVHTRVSWLNPRKCRDITIVGEKKMLTFDDLNLEAPIQVYDKGVSEDAAKMPYVDDYVVFRASVRHGDMAIPHVLMREPLQAECDEFLDCITQGRRPVADGYLGVAVVRTLEAIDRSMQSNGAEEPVTTADARLESMS